MTTTLRAKAPALMLAGLAALFILFSLMMSTAAPASADHGGAHDPPELGTEVVIPGTGNGTGDGGDGDSSDPDDEGGNGGVDGGGGGGVTVPAGGYSRGNQGFFPSNPPGQIGGRAPGDPGYTDDSQQWSYNNKCGGNYTFGGGAFSEPYIGWTWFEVGALVPPFIQPGDDEELPPPLRKATAGGYSCIKPPLYRERAVRCAVYADGYLDGPMNNPDQASQRQNMARQRTAFDLGGRDNPSQCNQSYKFASTAQPVAWGQYELNMQAKQVRCTQRIYYTVDQRTGSIPASEIINCSGAYTVGNDRARAELFCPSPYWHQGWTNNYTFTAADCPTTTWNCGPQTGQYPTFAGILNTNAISVLDDGKVHRATWAQPQPEGDLQNIRDKKVRLSFMSGSPFRVGSLSNGDDQPFMVDPALTPEFRTGWQQNASNNNNTAYDLKFMAAGTAGDPWKARPEWNFRAGFAVWIPRWRINAETGVLTQTGLNKIYVASNQTCVGRPMQVDVHRARNSS